MPLFGKSKEEKELEREVKFRQGLSRVRNYIEKSKETRKRLWELGKRALQLGDEAQFRNIARAYLRLGDIINRWERYLVAAETVAVQRGHIKATREFIGSIEALSQLMMSGAKPEDLLRMQRDLEMALARARNLDEALSVVMDASSEAIFSAEGLSEDALREVEAAMRTEVGAEGTAELDERISRGLKQIEEEMRREIK